MADNHINVVETYWSGVAQRLDAEVEVINRLVPHRPEQGRANEITLFGLLKSLLPANLGIGTGIVIDRNGKCSSQIDLIIFDQASQPQILAQTTQLLFPVETVLMAIEVKTTLSDDEIVKCSEAKVKLDGLTRSSTDTLIPYLLVAFKSSLLPGTLAEKVVAIEVDKRPDTLCVLNPGIIGGLAIHLRTPVGDDNVAYQLGLTPLHMRDPKAGKLSMKWDCPTEAERGSSKVVRDGRTYPVTALSSTNRTRYIGEPGRALLLFCQAMISQLSARGFIRTPFLHHYLSGLAAELAPLD